MMYNRNSGTSSNHCRIFNTGKKLSNFDCHSIVLNEPETRLLLVGNHDIALINFESIYSNYDHAAHNDSNILLPTLNDIEKVTLFDSCNINRPIAEWNHSDPNQFAVAIDRVVRLYGFDHGKILETNTIIDSQHQRPISTISYAPYDSTWLLTGSLDGQIQVWDTRNCSPKSPASLKFTQTTPFSIRRIQWSSTQSESSNLLAVQFDRCVRVYDIRRADTYLSSPTDVEHTQRILGMDWTKQHLAIVTLSKDTSIRIFSTKGQLLAESFSNEQSLSTISKFRTTAYDNLFVGACRDSSSPSTYGFLGWHLDENRQFKPLANHILSTTPSAIADFCVVKNSRFYSSFTNSSSSHISDDLMHHCLLLTWCRDGTLCLVDMDSKFREIWTNNHVRAKILSLSDPSHSMNSSRTSINLSRNSSSTLPTEAMKIGPMDSGDTIDDDEDDNAFQEIPGSPHNSQDTYDANEEYDCPILPDRTNNTVTEVSLANEFNSVHHHYGSHIVVDTKDEKSRTCILRCIYSFDDSPFYICLRFSRYYPTISQLNVVFKFITIINDERFKLFQSHMKKLIDETCYKCFFNGELCLHRCLVKLKNLFEANVKEERQLASKQLPKNASSTKHDQTSNHDGLGAMISFANNNHNNPNASSDNISNRAFAGLSSSARTTESQLSIISFSQGHPRTCGARFSACSQLVCFGRTIKSQQSNLTASITTLGDGTDNRPQSLPMRSTSLTVTKTRENSSTDEHSSYRTVTATNTVQIQYIQNNQRLPIFSAPVRSSFGTSMLSDHHHRLSQVYRRSHGQLSHPQSTVSIYDISILFPNCKKLADEYNIDIKNAVEMCEMNQLLTRNMGKTNLSKCWHLLAGLLSVQTSLKDDDPWFQSPIAQGLVKHLISTYFMNGDIQSASMFVLAASETSLLKTRLQSRLINEHEYDPILYAYASLLHRWRHFYKRTQILSQIDHNCQSPAPFNQVTTSITIACSICLQPVLGQHFLCALCGHGGHLTHMHEWFSSEGSKHRTCPDKDCTCRCITKQQELLAMNTIQLQQQQHQAHTVASRSYFRQPSSNARPL